MIVIGIDPGTARMGYGILEYSKKSPHKIKLIKSGVFITKPDQDQQNRLLQLYRNINELIDSHKPDSIVIEKLFFNTNAKTAMIVGQARGIVMLSAADNNLKMFEYTALQAKLVLTGYGRSDKKEMQEAVRKTLSLKEVIKSDDANDAVAMALCYLKKEYDIAI
ncbi:MAG TPA: crossover junction endodeoxyribonuclease RuvC [bacterium]|jgi:crossover junction endodeoxyribonuclease RuvC|nr:crossover junction endodeoxyribonuclease RuvC [bacterium]HOA18308.1 crossover junction endodeoxyribonuclease RuvC [bacterium]